MLKNLEQFNRTLISLKACLDGRSLKWFYPILALLFSILFLTSATAYSLQTTNLRQFQIVQDQIQNGFTEVFKLDLPCQTSKGKLSCDEPIETWNTEDFTVSVLNENESLNSIVFLEEKFKVQINDFVIETSYNSDFDFFQNYDPDSSAMRTILLMDNQIRSSSFIRALILSLFVCILMLLIISSFFTLLDKKKTSAQYSRKEWFKITMLSMLNCSILSTLVSMLLFPNQNLAISLFLIVILFKSGMILRMFVASQKI